MTRRNGNAAGKRLERQIARDLRAWLGEGWRVQRNQTDRQRGESGTPGEFVIDRIADDADGPEVWPLAIECKASLTFTALHLWSPTALLSGWWEQAVRQAGSTHHPMLVCSGRSKESPREPVLAIVRPDLWLHVADWPSVSLDLCGEQVRAVPWEGVLRRPVTVLCELGAPSVALAGRTT